jgi:peptide/nickel transport system ATP-binding protein
MEQPNEQSVLEVRDLVTSFSTEHGKITPVNGVNFKVNKGKTLAIVGESGSGKSVTSLSVMRLIPTSNGQIEEGQILFQGKDVLQVPEREMRHLRGNRMAMIFQEPMTALNPVYTVAQQICEVFRLHQGLRGKAALGKALEMLELVHISDPQTRLHCYPHELSGGMRQRVMIAMALACNPALLIADEPTTALDVTIQAQVLQLMKKLQEDLGTAILFITHDLGVVAEVADEVLVMYAGQIVEHASVFDIFERPQHPYTKGLMASLPKLSDRKDKGLDTIKGIVPSLWDLPEGCRFAKRCSEAQDDCVTTPQHLVEIGNHHQISCHVVANAGGAQ